MEPLRRVRVCHARNPGTRRRRLKDSCIINLNKGGDTMSSEEQQEAAPGKVARNPATEFAAFCAAERERRSNADSGFDAEVFDEAVELIVHKLEALNAEGF